MRFACNDSNGIKPLCCHLSSSVFVNLCFGRYPRQCLGLRSNSSSSPTLASWLSNANSIDLPLKIFNEKLSSSSSTSFLLLPAKSLDRVCVFLSRLLLVMIKELLLLVPFSCHSGRLLEVSNIPMYLCFSPLSLLHPEVVLPLPSAFLRYQDLWKLLRNAPSSALPGFL